MVCGTHASWLLAGGADLQTVRNGLATTACGPNGAGRSTTMRLILGLDRPDSGVAPVDGERYGSYRYPLFEVGALLEARSGTGCNPSTVRGVPGAR